MASAVRSLRLPESLREELDREFATRGIREWSTGVIDLLTEAIRMRRVPGIAFADSISGRRPVLAGTGIDVWEVIATWQAVGHDEAQLREAYNWLTPAQLRAALGYHQLYPDEIDARIALDESWTPERIRRELPFASLGPGILPREGPTGPPSEPDDR